MDELEQFRTKRAGNGKLELDMEAVVLHLLAKIAELERVKSNKFFASK